MKFIKGEKLPKNYNHKEVENKIVECWDKEKIFYGFDQNTNKNIFSVDTPPPTASGYLHIGHVFSYSHQDFIVRYRRMMGDEIFYPMGWDDNGLPTERRVQNVFGITCDPTVAYNNQFKATENHKKKPHLFY